MGNVSTRQTPGGNGVGQLIHDLRHKVPSYIRHPNSENVVIFNDKIATFRTSEPEKKGRQFRIIINELRNLKKLQEDIYQEKIGQKSQLKNHFVNGVITFSPDMKKEYKKNKKQFLKTLKNHLQELAEEQGMKLTYAVIHTDEKTPHVHYTLQNFDERGKNIFKQSFGKKQHGEKLQDISGKHWEGFGTGFKRGKKKTKKLNDMANNLFKKDYDELNASEKGQVFKNSNTRHLSVQEAHEYEKEHHIKTTKREVNMHINKLADRIIENSRNEAIIGEGKINPEELKKSIIKELHTSFKTQITSRAEAENRELKKVLKGADFAVDTIEEQKKIIQEQAKKIKEQENKIKTYENDKSDYQREIRKLEETVEDREGWLKVKNKKIEKYENILGKNNIDTRNLFKDQR